MITDAERLLAAALQQYPNHQPFNVAALAASIGLDADIARFLASNLGHTNDLSVSFGNAGGGMEASLTAKGIANAKVIRIRMENAGIIESPPPVEAAPPAPQVTTNINPP